ncbi:MAG: DUF4160 domain-containing protein [Cytophagaceae bacterium]|nr:DUF4160 domain-containing protein [Cytophagaceae bacterium]
MTEIAIFRFGSFEGIKIYVYRHDHNPPHFHAIYTEYEAVIDIQTLEVRVSVSSNNGAEMSKLELS